jgi:CMP-N,N'-diacetyllegionaminic acid synthase
MILWSIDAAKGVDDICDVLVSTDDSAIAEIARAGGALVPWLRPPELATDSATSVDVCLHALDWYETHRNRVDGVILLQPTSPFRSRETLRRGIELFRGNQAGAVVAVSPVKVSPAMHFQLSVEGKLEKIASSVGDRPAHGGGKQSAYTINGCFYAVGGRFLRENRAFFGADTLPLVVEDRCESLDIDDDWDWMIAEQIVSRYYSGPTRSAELS